MRFGYRKSLRALGVVAGLNAIGCVDGTPCWAPLGDAATVEGSPHFSCRVDAGGPDGSGADGGLSDLGGGRGGDLYVPKLPNAWSGDAQNPGFEIRAFTIREDSVESIMLVSVFNGSMSTLCTPVLDAVFVDSSGAPLRELTISLDSKSHRRADGTGALTQCFGPGQVAIGTWNSRRPFGQRLEQVEEIRWRVRGVEAADAAPTDDLLVQAIDVANIGPQARFVGELKNEGPTEVRFPRVVVYGLTAEGRPLVRGLAIADRFLSPGEAWNFETTTFIGIEVTEVMVFAGGNDS